MTNMTTWTNYAARSGAATTTWNYDPYRGWLDSKAYPTNGGPTYAYTHVGRLASRTWARGTNTTYAYNTAGDLSTVTYSDGTPGVSYTYDRRGRAATAARNGITTTLSYNSADRLLSEAYSGGALANLTVASAYDQYLRRTSLSLQNSGSTVFQQSFTYDPASRLSTASDGNGNQATYSYLANSPLVSQIVFAHSGATAMTTAKQYDCLNRLTQISSAPSASPAIAYAYLYNLANFTP
jgi:YD repeat-containing protein